MLDLSMEIENDLGVDSVRRVELLATLEEHFPAALEKRETIIAATTLADLVEALNSAEAPSAVDNPTAPAAAPPQTPTQAPPVPTAASATADTSPIAPAPPATSAAPAVSSARATTAGSDAGDVETQVLGLVAQITGFPRNMLDLSMNIEDDLGVDSVRRVELLATFEETFPAALEHREAILAVETLGDLVAALALAQKSGSTPTPAPRTTALPANASAGEELRASDSSQSLPLSLEPGQVPVHLDLDLAPAQAGEPASTLPPTTAAASADPASPASTSKLSTDPAVLEEQVLTLVASVTGFSRQMLDLTMDIEDDLGIDSVRRVELLAALEEAMPAALERRAAVMEARTLGDVVQVLSSGPTELPEPSGDASDHPGMPGSANAPAAPVEPAIAPAEQEDPESTDAGPLTGKVNRYAFQPVQLGELPDCAEGEITGGWMIGFDGSALAEALIAELKALGAKIHTVAYPGSSITADYVLPDLERETLDQAVQQAATACDGLRGFIHFEPAGEVAGAAESLADLAACRAAFLLAGSLEPVLLKAAEEGATPHFMTINPIAGNAGEEEPAGWHKLAGTGLPGLVKSLVREWSVVRGHALDVPSTLPVDTAARAILAELANPEQAAVDITLDAEGKRWTETPVELPKLTEPVPPIPDHDGVVLAVGGAYGVGAACAQRLAQAGASRFAVLGRTPLDEDDPEWARGITENAELQQRYIAHLRENQVRVTPVKVKRELDRLDKQRTIRATLARLREAGADARYYRADINDAGAVSSTINEVREELGTITDLLFIAGNVAPKRINLKTPADFDHVVGTKVTGLANLLAEFPAEQLRRLVLFSSIAARNGNHGQSDYCFANAVLSGFAAACQRMRPACRAVSIEWGAWNGGMFLPWKDRVVQRTNVTVFEPEEGAEFFLAEYAAESGGAPIVLVCGQADSSKTLAPEARDGAAELDPTTPRVTIEASYG
jgi:NAD(P)-dependent dehydrogenase (short-subunit alcohol dehydrogenase family)/acyl carrier protein